MSKIVDIMFLKEYTIVKYIRHNLKRRKHESCERIPQGTGQVPTRTCQGYRRLEANHQHDLKR